MSHPIELQRVQLGNITLAMLVSGDEAGEPVLLLHGIPASAELFRDVIPYFTTAGYRVYAPFMPGYGETRLPQAMDYSLTSTANLYALWLEKENIAPVWVIGHDLGGMVAQIMAVRYPHLISHLSLGDAPVVDTFPVLSITLMQSVAWLGLYSPLAALRLMPNPLIRRALRQAFHDTSVLTEAVENRVFWDSKVHTPDGRREWAQHLRALNNRESISIAPMLKNVDMPTLLIWASNDEYQRWNIVGKRLQALLPNKPELVLVGGAGHFLPLEKPELYAVFLLDWRKRLQTK